MKDDKIILKIEKLIHAIIADISDGYIRLEKKKTQIILRNNVE